MDTRWGGDGSTRARPRLVYNSTGKKGRGTQKVHVKLYKIHNTRWSHVTRASKWVGVAPTPSHLGPLRVKLIQLLTLRCSDCTTWLSNGIEPLMTRNRKVQPDQQSYGLLQVSTKHGIITASRSSSVYLVHGLRQHQGRGQPALAGRSLLEGVCQPPRNRSTCRWECCPMKLAISYDSMKTEIM